MPKFVIDEDMPRSTGQILQTKGYTAMDIRDHGLCGAEDEVLTECRFKVEKSISLHNGYIRYLASKKQKEKEYEFTNQLDVFIRFSKFSN